MTCIVALVHDDSVYMGADSAGVSGLDVIVRSDRKLFKNGPFLMGFTSSFRMGQLLTYKLKVPKQKKTQDVMEFMVTTFVESVRTTLSDGGYTHVRDSRETGGNFLVGYRGRLFQIENDFQVGECSYLYDACGCGTPYALGSLRNSGHLEPRERLQQALETASFFSAGVCAPFHFDTLENMEET